MLQQVLELNNTLSHTRSLVAEMRRLNVVSAIGTLKTLTSAAMWVRRTGGRSVQLTLFAFSTLVLPQLSLSQVFGTATNIITVDVQPITVIQVSSSILNFTFSAANAVAGQDQMILTDQTSTLSWGTNSSVLNKITVSTSLAAPKYLLQVQAINLTAGGPAGNVTVATTPKDFVTTIARSMGTCTLLYTVTALASQGMGTDSHTITFTITS